MKKILLQYLAITFLVFFSCVALSETNMTIHKDNQSKKIYIDDYESFADIYINNPGEDSWVEKGKVINKKGMPACFTIVSNDLKPEQLEKFLADLEINIPGLLDKVRKLSPEQYKGTWIFLDKSPAFLQFGDTQYTIQTKSKITLGQLLQSVGGKRYSEVSIEFSRGCVALAPRPFLPKY